MKNFNLFIEKLPKDQTYMIVLLDVLFLILPGVAVLFVFHQDLFQSLDWVKIILLSASITAPLAFMNMLFSMSVFESDEDDKNIDDIHNMHPIFRALSFGIFVAGFSVYILLWLHNIYAYIPLNGWTIAVVEGLVLISSKIESRIKK